MNHIDLQQLLERELKQLPTPRAPESLLPRVLAATVHPGSAKPYGGWLAWPRAWQVVSAAALIALVAGAWMLWPLVGPADFLWRTAPETPAPVITLVRNAGETATVVRVLWQVLVQPVATYILVLAISLALACAVLWTAVERLALGGATYR